MWKLSHETEQRNASISTQFQNPSWNKSLSWKSRASNIHIFESLSFRNASDWLPKWLLQRCRVLQRRLRFLQLKQWKLYWRWRTCEGSIPCEPLEDNLCQSESHIQLFSNAKQKCQISVCSTIPMWRRRLWGGTLSLSRRQKRSSSMRGTPSSCLARFVVNILLTIQHL